MTMETIESTTLTRPAFTKKQSPDSLGPILRVFEVLQGQKIKSQGHNASSPLLSLAARFPTFRRSDIDPTFIT